MQRTLILIKPDALQRRLLGRLLARFEDKGLNLIAMKMLRITPELARQHYAEHLNKGFYSGLEDYITSGPAVAAVVEGPEAIRLVRELVGPTDGREAPAGTMRGDFSTSRQMNLVHASDGPESAPREIQVFFEEDEMCLFEPTLQRWLQAPDGS